ncbi:MAG: putative signal transducing protein [Luteolibacter sp.]
MTTIATFTVPEEAHLFRTFLESRGIEGFVLDENVVQLFWHYSNAIGGVRVAVEDNDIEDASTAYQEYMAALREGPYPEQPVRIWPAVALVSLIFGMPLLLFGRRGKRTTPPE